LYLKLQTWRVIQTENSLHQVLVFAFMCWVRVLHFFHTSSPIIAKGCQVGTWPNRLTPKKPSKTKKWKQW